MRHDRLECWEVIDFGGVGVGETGTALQADLDHSRRSQVPLARELVGEGLAFHVLHDDERPLPVVLANVEHLDDVGVAEPGRDPRLAQKTRAELIILGEMVRYELDCDRPLQLGVIAEVDDRHPAAAEGAINPEAAKLNARRAQSPTPSPPSPWTLPWPCLSPSWPCLRSRGGVTGGGPTQRISPASDRSESESGARNAIGTSPAATAAATACRNWRSWRAAAHASPRVKLAEIALAEPARRTPNACGSRAGGVAPCPPQPPTASAPNTSPRPAT